LKGALAFLVLLIGVGLNPSCGRYNVELAGSACHEVDCSHHGTCALTSEDTAICACDAGYRNDGPTACVLDPASVRCDTEQDCDDSDPCTDDSCDNGQCHHLQNTATCDDGLYCTIEDACDGLGQCTGQNRNCESNDNVCTKNVCNEELDLCQEQPHDNGRECGERWCQELVLWRGECLEGSCNVEAIVENCFDDNPCTQDICDANDGTCRWEDDIFEACDDSNPCTMEDHCDGDGHCLGEPLDADGDNFVSAECPEGNDCDDEDPLVNPEREEGGEELCNDDKDNDCDELTDAADPDCS